MHMHRESDKAQRYLDLLDSTRCNGKWEDIPELVRKLQKHAPHRKCLILSAQSERHVAVQSSKRPTTASSLSTGLPQLIPPLLNAIETEKDFPEDVFQAQICLGWIHWTIKEPSLALSRLPANVAESFEKLRHSIGTLAGWTYICLVKGAYIRGASQEIVGTPLDVFKTYKAVLPYVSTVTSTSAGGREEQQWTERVLMQYCTLAERHSRPQDEKTVRVMAPETSLAPFRAWANFWEGKAGQESSRFDGVELDKNLQRRHVWQAYYNVISDILQSGRAYPSASAKVPDGPEANLRLQQSVELRRVEATYEGILLKEVRFPEANRTNAEVENWVEQVMANWRVLCGPEWEDEDLGQGGQNATGRNVLDILYRAATKTFHSTPILRHLFTVHTSLAEFDLAGKALDSYVEIVGKGMARSEKSGETSVGLDTADIAMRTVAVGISMFCTFGRRREAEKAQELAKVLRKWLQTRYPGSNSDTITDMERMHGLKIYNVEANILVSSKSLAAAIRGIGISQAHWARLTFEPSRRAELHEKAMSNFQDAVKIGSDDEENVDTLYALALILAETRDLENAIVTVKAALSLESQSSPTSALAKVIVPGSGTSIKLWHLLALLLSARQDFDTAIISCEAALDSFTKDGEQQYTSQMRGQMGNNLKQNILEIKMTQLALTEVNEGPEVAVNASGELLELYANLFGPIISSTKVEGLSRSSTSIEGSSGTNKSIRGSIFSRTKPAEPRLQANNSIRTQTAPTNLPQAPSISITNGNGALQHSSGHHLFHHGSKKLQKSNSKRSMGSVRRSMAPSPAKKAASHEAPGSSNHFQRSNIADGVLRDDELKEASTDNSQPYAPDEVGVAVSRNIPPKPALPTTGHDVSPTATHSMPTIPHNYDEKKQPLPLKQPANQDIRLPTISPNSSSSQPQSLFVETEQQHHAFSLLIKIWLLITGLYRRAKMYDDAKEALEEALKHVRSVELVIITRQSSARAFAESGWGGVKSVDELWADVYTEQGNLHLARSAPHDALLQYESALTHFPDHPGATVGLSNLLLDVYSQKIPSQSPQSSVQALLLSSESSVAMDDTAHGSGSASSSAPLSPQTPRTPTTLGLPSTNPSPHLPPSTTPRPASSHRKTPEALNRLAARDRAYGLLSSLTKLGSAWDNSAAWFALARAYEEGGQLDRAKEVLWWVVELEEKRPVRGWDCLGQGYSL